MSNKIREALKDEINELFDDITVEIAHIRRLVETDQRKDVILAELDELEEALL